MINELTYSNIQGGSNMTGTICLYTSHSLSRSYLNHLVQHAQNSVYVTACAIKPLHKSESFQNSKISLPVHIHNVSLKSLSNKITFTSLRSTLRETVLSVWAQYTNGLSVVMVV